MTVCFILILVLMLKKKHAAKPSDTKKNLSAYLRFTFDCIQFTIKCNFIWFIFDFIQSNWRPYDSNLHTYYRELIAWLYWYKYVFINFYNAIWYFKCDQDVNINALEYLSNCVLRKYRLNLTALCCLGPIKEGIFNQSIFFKYNKLNTIMHLHQGAPLI